MTNIQDIVSLANRLSEARKEITSKKEEMDKILKPLEEERDAIQATLLQELKENNLASLKSDDGVSYIRSSKKVYEIISEIPAFKWAYENRFVSIDKKLVNQKLKELETLPDWVKESETEFISIRTKKDE